MHTQLIIFSCNMAQFIDTNRGGKNLHFEGYIYTKIRASANGLLFWRCQSHKAYWTLNNSFICFYFYFFWLSFFLWVNLIQVDFTIVDCMKVDFMTSCTYNSWSRGSWSCESWSRVSKSSIHISRSAGSCGKGEGIVRRSSSLTSWPLTASR